MGTNSFFQSFSAIILLIFIIIPGKIQCWLFSPRITPYYYPFPYPVPASMFPGGSTGSSSSTSSVSGYIGQSSIQSTPDYNYNWYNYQTYPNSGVLFPSSTGSTSGIGGNPSGSLFPVSSMPSFLPASGSLLRSWWTRKFNKFGLRSPGSSGTSSGSYGYSGISGSGSPCSGYWSSGNIGSPCLSSNLCCYPLVVQTNVESTARPYHTDSVTYPSTGYLYQPHGYKTSTNTLRPQASENVDDVVDSSS